MPPIGGPRRHSSTFTCVMFVVSTRGGPVVSHLLWWPSIPSLLRDLPRPEYSR